MSDPMQANTEQREWPTNAIGAAVIAAGIALAFAVRSPYMAYALYTFALLVIFARVSSLMACSLSGGLPWEPDGPPPAP